MYVKRLSGTVLEHGALHTLRKSLRFCLQENHEVLLVHVFFTDRVAGLCIVVFISLIFQLPVIGFLIYPLSVDWD